MNHQFLPTPIYQNNDHHNQNGMNHHSHHQQIQQQQQHVHNHHNNINNVNNSLHSLNINSINSSNNNNGSYSSYSNNNSTYNNNVHQYQNHYESTYNDNNNCNNSSINNSSNNNNINHYNNNNNINGNSNGNNNMLKIPLPLNISPNSNNGIINGNNNKMFSKLDLSKVPNSYQLAHNSSMPNSPTSSNISPSTPTSMALNLSSLKSILDSPPAAPAQHSSSSNNHQQQQQQHTGFNIPLLQLKQINSTTTTTSSSSSSTSSPQLSLPLQQLQQPSHLIGIPTLNTNDISHQRSNPSSATNSPRTHYYGGGNDLSSVENSPFTTPLSSPRGPISPRATANSTAANLQSNIRVEEQWKKIEYYVNDLSHFIYESIRNKDYTNLSELKDKIEEVVNTSKEIEIIHSIAKSLPPQTRARKKRSTKAEKLQKDLIGIKRSYVTTPKSKGTYCIFCGTMETPEWRKGPGGHKTLCNACGLHYAKNIKKETQNNSSPNSNPQPVVLNGNVNVNGNINGSNNNINNNNINNITTTTTTTTSTPSNTPSPNQTIINNSNLSPESAMSVSKLISE